MAPFLNGISCVPAGTCETAGSYLDNFAAVPNGRDTDGGHVAARHQRPAPGERILARLPPGDRNA